MVMEDMEPIPRTMGVRQEYSLNGTPGAISEANQPTGIFLGGKRKPTWTWGHTYILKVTPHRQ